MQNDKDIDMSQFIPESSLQSKNTVGKASVKDGVSNDTASRIQNEQPEQSTQQRISSRQRRASLDEYREIFMTVPKIIDRQPVFVSRETRDRIDQIVRRLGGRKMSVSGLLENLARHHLELYAEDMEQWKRL